MKVKGDLKKFYLNLGKNKYQKGNYAEAIEGFEKAMEKGVKSQECCPELDDSYYKLVRQYCKKEYWENAKRYISKALKYNPHSVLYLRLTTILDKNIKDPQASMHLYLNQYGSYYNIKGELQTLLDYAKKRGIVVEPVNFDHDRFSPLIKETYCVGVYRPGYDKDAGNPFSKAIRYIKKEGSDKISPFFGKLMVEYLVFETTLVDCLDLVIPVPADPSRRIDRGYHIVDHMKEPFERVLALPVCKDIVKKIKSTPSLRRYSRKDRAEILSGAFRLINPTIIRNRNVLIIDDVLTYGTTICEVAKTIKEDNPKEIYALVLSKTERSKRVR